MAGAGKEQKLKNTAVIFSIRDDIKKPKNNFFRFKSNRKSRATTSQQALVAYQNTNGITTGRLTIRRGIFPNALTSELIARDPLSTRNNESKAILNQDLFQLINLSSNKCVKRVKIDSVQPLNEFNSNDVSCTRSTLIASETIQTTLDSNRTLSIFRQIDENYRKLIANRNIERIEEKTGFNEDTISERFRKYFKQDSVAFLHKDLQDFANKIDIKAIQKKIIKTFFQHQREFSLLLKRMENSRKVVGNPPAHQLLHSIENSTDGPERCRTPENEIEFADESYHTPKNSYDYPEIAPTQSKLKQAIIVYPADHHHVDQNTKLINDPKMVEIRANITARQPMLFEIDEEPDILDKLGVSSYDQKLLKAAAATKATKVVDDNTGGKEFFNPRWLLTAERPTKLTGISRRMPLTPDLHSSPTGIRTQPRKKLVYSCLDIDTDNNSSVRHDLRRKFDLTFDSDADDESDADPMPLSPNLVTGDDSGLFMPQHTPTEFKRMATQLKISSAKKMKFSPNEYNLRRKYAPHTLSQDDSGLSLSHDDIIPKVSPSPDLKYYPRLQH